MLILLLIYIYCLGLLFIKMFFCSQWFTFFYAIYYFVFYREYNYLIRNLRKRIEDDDDIDSPITRV